MKIVDDRQLLPPARAVFSSDPPWVPRDEGAPTYWLDLALDAFCNVGRDCDAPAFLPIWDTTLADEIGTALMNLLTKGFHDLFSPSARIMTAVAAAAIAFSKSSAGDDEQSRSHACAAGCDCTPTNERAPMLLLLAMLPNMSALDRIEETVATCTAPLKKLVTSMSRKQRARWAPMVRALGASRDLCGFLDPEARRFVEVARVKLHATLLALIPEAASGGGGARAAGGQGTAVATAGAAAAAACWACGGVPSAKCGRCVTAVYCNETCQRRDWEARHKKQCKAIAARRES
jgi:hypothetical protein